MCFEFDAVPPIAPIEGAAVDSERLFMESPDGTQFNAFAARPSDSNGVGVVVLPDVRGLFPFYEELALRFAEHGMPSVAIDYFGRTALTAPRDSAFPFMDHVVQTSFATVAMDTNTAIEFLRAPAGGEVQHVFTVGFCFGGARSWLQSATTPGVTGTIGFYGSPSSARDGSPGPLLRAAELKAPILALQSSIDDHIPVAAVKEFDEAMTKAGVDHEIVYYDAPHSFFDRTQEEHAEASADAWNRVLAFISKYSGVAVA